MSLTEILVVAGVVICILLFAFMRWQPRLLIGVMLVLLVAAAVILLLGHEGLAEAVANYAYYALFAGIVLIFIESVRKGKQR